MKSALPRCCCEGYFAAYSVASGKDFTLTLTLSLKGEGIVESPWFEAAIRSSRRYPECQGKEGKR